MPHSPTIGALAAAMAKAQCAYGKALKASANPFFKSKYADLASCYDACREALAVNGLAVVQTTEVTPTGVLLVSVLIHSSGEWMSGQYPIRPMKEDPQGYGSAITYARRYALMALAGLAAEDDDGEEASGRAAKPVKAATVTGEIKTRKPTFTPEQQLEAGEVRQAIMEAGGAPADAEVKALWHRMAYDDPGDTIMALRELLRKWQDISDQANANAGAAQ